jgi:hypothetical protein
MVPDVCGADGASAYDARQTLPEVVERYPQIDIFIHDSDQLPAHAGEFRNAWPT